MKDYKIKDPKLAKQGENQIVYAEGQMKALVNLRKEFSVKKPFSGLVLGACLHVTKETAVLARTLKEGGAKIFLCGSNPLSTQDDVAAALALEGISVYAWRGENEKEYWQNIDAVISKLKTQNSKLTTLALIDDGADLIIRLHEKYPKLLSQIKSANEETTTGVNRLRALEKAGKLKIPVIAVNDNQTKRMFDNFYGTGQSTIDGILRSTNVLLAGKTFIVCGYGFCGKGVAQRARGMGARVIVCEVNPVLALQAKMDGFEVLPIKDASKIGDIFVTATGQTGVISVTHFRLMKDGAILANAGHFDVEVDVESLNKISTEKKEVRSGLTSYKISKPYSLQPKTLFLCGQGRLVNLACAEGHPSEVMTLSFLGQTLALKYGLEHNLEPGLHRLPEELDQKIANLQLSALGVKIDKLTREQKEYLSN